MNRLPISGKGGKITPTIIAMNNNQINNTLE
jgi:hypothetical protein